MSVPLSSSEIGRRAGAAKAPEAAAQQRPRIWEIDFLRGLSIILMVGYHLLYDLGAMAGFSSFLGFSTNLTTPAWTAAQYFFAGLFVVLSGISSTLSRGNVRRAVRLSAFALLITAVTFFYDRASAIYFGILHCLGVSILIYGLTLQKASASACAAAGVLVLVASAALPLALKGATIDFNWLLPLGIHGPFYQSFDYFPLFPWFGIFLGGAALGKSVYASKKSLIPRSLPVTFVNVAGRYSLWIYIVHQPVILGILYLSGLVR